MTPVPSRLNVMIAHAGQGAWAQRLAQSLAPLPVGLHWSHTDEEAIGLAVSRGMHVAVLDADLPGSGGLAALRRMRRLGLNLPCILACVEPSARILRDALELDVFSVARSDAAWDVLTPLVMKVARQVYRLDWPLPGDVN